jgi:hypothetical protein
VLLVHVVGRGFLQRHADERDVLRVHPREGLFVDPVAFPFRHDLCQLLDQRLFASALVVEGFLDRPSALTARDRLPVHGGTIIGAI